MTDGLPAGWTVATLGDLCEVNPRNYSVPADDDELVSKVPMAAVEAETGRMDPSETIRYRDRKSLTPFEDNDVLFAKVTPCMENGKIALADGLHNGKGVGSTELYVLRSLGAIEPKYLMYYLLQPGVRKRAAESMTGAVGLRRVPKNYLANLKIPVPSLAEQRRIVSTLDAFLDRVDAAMSSIDDVKRKIKQCVDSTVDRNFNELTEKKRIGDLFKVAVGTTPSRSRSDLWEGDIPWVSSGEVSFGRISDTREKISEEGLGRRETRLHPPGTVLLAMIGEGKTRGQVAILDIHAAHNQNCASIRVSESGYLSEFVYWYLFSRYEHNRRAASGGNQPALNKAKVEDILIPVAQVELQRQIVSQIEGVVDRLSRIQSSVNDIEKKAEALRISILAAAFKGELAVRDRREGLVEIALAEIRGEVMDGRRGMVLSGRDREFVPAGQSPALLAIQEELPL
ncbi:restriction endonuclease subunit S [Nocardia sp. CA-145437]|uniref:restriction endonuclease subunit S n=1 Tax=Nocardia sp. CA-145437 TaxID=3239980 RepID=UPI003D969D10